MNKAEERAFERYPDYRETDGEYVAQIHKRKVFVDGYHQAEKDLELTWKDIEKIVDLYDDVYCDFSIDGKGGKINAEEHYQKVLKQFKNYKERKEK